MTSFLVGSTTFYIRHPPRVPAINVFLTYFTHLPYKRLELLTKLELCSPEAATKVLKSFTVTRVEDVNKIQLMMKLSTKRGRPPFSNEEKQRCTNVRKLSHGFFCFYRLPATAVRMTSMTRAEASRMCEMYNREARLYRFSKPGYAFLMISVFLSLSDVVS